jgi:hypothetical protein
LAIFKVKVRFTGSSPRELPVREVARPKHIASLFESLLSIRPPYLWFMKFSTLTFWAKLKPFGKLGSHSKCGSVVETGENRERNK